MITLVVVAYTRVLVDLPRAFDELLRSEPHRHQRTLVTQLARIEDGANLPDDMPWVPWVLLHHPTKASTLYAGMGDGARGFGFNPDVRGAGAFYRSDDRGETWDCIMPDLPSVLTAWVAVD